MNQELRDFVSDWSANGYGIALVDKKTLRVIDPYIDPEDYNPFETVRKNGEGWDGEIDAGYLAFHSGILETNPDHFVEKE